MSQPKVPEWHVVYDEWAIHTPTGRLRHLPCKRDIPTFSRFKKNNTVLVPVEYKEGRKKVTILREFRDPSLHTRRADLMNNRDTIIHKCQGDDPYEEIVEIEVPSMVIEIAICYMKV